MNKAEEVKLSMKVVINKEKTKVLFAEAGSDFTDVLLSFLLLPLGTIVKALENHYGENVPLIGSFNSLCKGVADLDTIHFCAAARKPNLLDGASCYDAESTQLRLKLKCTRPSSSNIYEKPYEGVFTKGDASFVISDDLRVMPNVEGSIMETLSSLGIDLADLDGVETRDVQFGFNEIMDLLKESLTSINPLTALVFPQSQMSIAREGLIHLHPIDKQVKHVNYKKMNLKVMLQKSTDKLLFAEADYDFISFLFGLLVIPLGKVAWFLGSNTGVESMDNLHRSLADNSKNMHLKCSETKDLLINAAWPINMGYRTPPTDFYDLNFACAVTSRRHQLVNEARVYMVSDDLTAAPLGLTSGISMINKLKVSLSDVKELEVQVGLKEGLSILKAALTSKTALTDGLIEPLLKKQEAQRFKKSTEQNGTEVGEGSKKRPKLEC